MNKIKSTKNEIEKLAKTLYKAHNTFDCIHIRNLYEGESQQHNTTTFALHK